MFHSVLISGLGIFVAFLGTYILALPDLDRTRRRHFYRIAPTLRPLFRLRENVKDTGRGAGFSSKDRTICYTFIDYIDQQGLEEPPEVTPRKITMGAARILVTFPGGTEEPYCRGGPSQIHFTKIVDLALERKCRKLGISIAWVGTLTAIVGTAL